MLPKDYINYILTGVHSCDYSDASGMLLLDVAHKCWSKEMLDICGISESQMPKLFESHDFIGTVDPEIAKQLGIPGTVKVCAGAGDNAAAAVGTGVVGEGGCNISLGTSGTVFISSETFGADQNNALHVFAHADGGYHLMGCMLCAAFCNKWLLEDIFKASDYAAELAAIKEEKLGGNHVFFLPYLIGERSPINDTLAFVKTFANGDRDFSFYRKPGADMMLTENDLPLEAIAEAKIFHFGTLSMTHAGIRRATEKAVETAKQSGVTISFDPNLRPPLWESLESARDAIAWGLGQCDILKIADNELEFMTGETDFYKGAAILYEKYPDIKVLNVTAGADGSYSFYGEDEPVFVPSCKLGGVIETTGAGDTFCASVLNFVLENGITGLTVKDREDMLRFANTAAYIVTTRKGAIRAMPEKENVLELLR